MLKIAVIGPEQSLLSIQDAVEDQTFDCHFQYYPYETLEEILELYKKHSSNWDGIIFSGALSFEFFTEHIQNANLPLNYLEIDPHYFFGQLLKFLTEHPDSSLSRTYIDFIGEFNEFLGLNDFITPEQFPISPKSFIYNDTLYEITLEDIKRHWLDRKIDVVFTRITNNISKFIELGIPYVHIYPSAKSIRETFQRAIDDMTLFYLEHNQLAVAHIDLMFNEATKSDFRLAEYFEVTMHKHLVDFRIQHTMNFNIQKLTYGYEISFSKSEIGSPQDHFNFPLLKHLEAHYPEAFNMGIGIGSSIEEGRLHAIEALTDAKHFGVRCGFLVDQNNRALGPIGQKNCIEYRPLPDQIETLSKTLSISTKNLERLIAYSKKVPVMTSDQVAESLNITIRSANRILSRLAAENILLIEEGAAETAGAGRPTKRYTFDKEKIKTLMNH